MVDEGRWYPGCGCVRVTTVTFQEIYFGTAAFFPWGDGRDDGREIKQFDMRMDATM
jgi:hypothetical protein